jgi:hypothetical protein
MQKTFDSRQDNAVNALREMRIVPKKIYVTGSWQRKVKVKLYFYSLICKRSIITVFWASENHITYL